MCVYASICIETLEKHIKHFNCVYLSGVQLGGDRIKRNLSFYFAVLLYFRTVQMCYFIVNTNLLHLANYLLNCSFTEKILGTKHDKASSF